jgi:protein-S-isoprenylcysteine O-methyltransferase Ste14
LRRLAKNDKMPVMVDSDDRGLWGGRRLLRTLGLRSSIVMLGALVILFSCSMLLVALIQALLEARFISVWWGPALVCVGVWILWSFWHSVIFPQHRARLLQRSAMPYRRAFLWDIYPGVTVGFAQMLRPAINGTIQMASLSEANVWLMLVGCACMVCAILTFAQAMRTIGIDNAGFVSEFVQASEFRPICTGIYGRVRHPLFWSGILLSMSLAMMVQSPAAWSVACMNMIYGLAYNIMEDRRLNSVFGVAYEQYAACIPRCLPWTLVGVERAPTERNG